MPHAAMQQGSPGACGLHLALIREACCRVFMLCRLYAALAELVGSWEGGGQASLTMLLVLNSPLEGVAYISPAPEKSLSEGTDVGGDERYLIAKSARGLKQTRFSAHHLYAFPQ